MTTFPRPIKKVFTNGLTVLVVPQKESPSVTVGVFVRAGAAYETKDNNGISHFLEHMCFKGTTRRPTPLAISSEFEQLGASYNAFTSRDLTGYYGKVASRSFEKILDLLADMYLNPTFIAEEIEKEKGVIVEEINMYEDEPRAKVSQILDATMYGDQPAGWEVAGVKKNIFATTRETFTAYRGAHYHAQKTIVVVAGNVDVRSALKKVTEKFSSITQAPRAIPAARVIENQKRPRIAVHQKPLDQTHLLFGIKTFPASDKQRHTLAMLSGVLGEGMSSRLFQKVREEMGAAYYVRSNPSLFATHGYLEIAAGVNHQKTIPAVGAVMDELKKLLRDGVSEKELARTKEHAIGTFALSLETSSDIGFFYGEQEVVLRELRSPRAIMDAIRAVRSSDVRRLARELFVNQRLSLAVVGPHSTPEAFLSAVRFV
ncbi:MAG: pitrilysin family protein [Candidatus Paceibacterota bacterium]|jgi:predicted Zn-dependent peptidase